MPRIFLSLLLVALMIQGPMAAEPVVIAHRGASGYLPEHTLAAAAAAHVMNADFVEQDVVLTSDDHPIVLHDIHLDTVTDVAQKFPGRARDDGRFYAIDFTLDEIKTLRVGGRVHLETEKTVFPARFPTEPKLMTIPTLEEELRLIQGMNHSRQCSVGVYPEIKHPAWHREQGKDISVVVLDVLGRYGYRNARDAIYLQCFDQRELVRIRHQLNCQLKLVQLIGDDEPGQDEFATMRTKEGLRFIATYAQGIGPDLKHVIGACDRDGNPLVTSLVDDAHQNGLVVHPYTFRADSLPGYVDSWQTLLHWFLDVAKVDGLFTDFPDRVSKLQ